MSSAIYPRAIAIAIAAVGLFACVLSAAPIVAGYRLPPPNSLPTDITLMTRLALDIGQGLAFEVVVALGVVTVLAIMVALATGLCILVRNNRLLEIPATCDDNEPRARTPQFPDGAHRRHGVLHRAHCGALPGSLAERPAR